MFCKTVKNALLPSIFHLRNKVSRSVKPISCKNMGQDLVQAWHTFENVASLLGAGNEFTRPQSVEQWRTFVTRITRLTPGTKRSRLFPNGRRNGSWSLFIVKTTSIGRKREDECITFCLLRTNRNERLRWSGSREWGGNYNWLTRCRWTLDGINNGKWNGGREKMFSATLWILMAKCKIWRKMIEAYRQVANNLLVDWFIFVFVNRI